MIRTRNGSSYTAISSQETACLWPAVTERLTLWTKSKIGTKNPRFRFDCAYASKLNSCFWTNPKRHRYSTYYSAQIIPLITNQNSISSGRFFGAPAAFFLLLKLMTALKGKKGCLSSVELTVKYIQINGLRPTGVIPNPETNKWCASYTSLVEQ